MYSLVCELLNWEEQKMAIIADAILHTRLPGRNFEAPCMKPDLGLSRLALEKRFL